jgi:hypothetical protein
MSEGDAEARQPGTSIDPTMFEDVGVVVDRPQIIIRRRSLVSRVPSTRVDLEHSLLSLAQGVSSPRKTCADAESWVMAGENITNRSGEVSFSLNEKLPCNAERRAGEGEYAWIGGEPFFTATPVSDRPVFLTIGITSTAIDPEGGMFEPTDGLAVNITVISWEPGGQKVGRVAFRWACTAVATRYFLPTNGHLPDREDLPDEEDLQVPPV